MKPPAIARPLSIFLLFTLWSLVISWPLILQPATHIPQGSEGVGTVPYFNTWTLQHNIDQLMRAWPAYWNAPIFAPTPGAFAFSEIQPLSAFLALPVWLNFGPAAGYNFVVILFLILNGWFAYWLMRTWGISHLPALLTGLLMQSLPIVAQEMGVLQLLALFGFLWSLLFLSRFLQSPSVENGLALALGLPVTFFTCGYYGLFSLIFLPLALLCFWRRVYFTPKLMGRLALVIIFALVFTLPLLWKQQAILASHAFTRNAQTVQTFSAQLKYYTQPLDYNLVYGQLFGLKFTARQRLFPGIMVIGLALMGLIFAPPTTNKRAKFYLALALALAFLLSLGLNLKLANWQPYALLQELIPGLAQLRSPFRFAAFGQLHLVLLAGLGLQAIRYWLLDIGKKRTVDGGRWTKVFSSVVRPSSIAVFVLAAIAILEMLALPLPLQALPATETAPWQSWLNEQAPGSRIILLPFAASPGVVDYEQTAFWMLNNRRLNAEMLNGYSGFFPPYHAALRLEMNEFPSEAGIQLLRQFETDYAVIHHSLPGAPSKMKLEQILPLLYFDEANKVAIYGLLSQN